MPVNNLVAGGHAPVTCLAVVCVVKRGVLNRQVQTTPGMIDKDPYKRALLVCMEWSPVKGAQSVYAVRGGVYSVTKERLAQVKVCATVPRTAWRRGSCVFNGASQIPGALWEYTAKPWVTRLCPGDTALP